VRFASVVITQKFADSVEAIVADAATRSITRAQTIDDEVDARISSLDQNARRGRKLPELDDDLIRELLVVKEDFRLIYRLNESLNLVEVLLLWPTRRPLRLVHVLDAE
jgi:plasmid stabilization system protein ParE